MIRRVAGIAAGLVLLATAGWGITISLYSTGLNALGQPLGDNQVDTNWRFYRGSDWSALSGAALNAYVFADNKQPLNKKYWEADTQSSQWITPTSARAQGGHLAIESPVSSYVAATSFTTPSIGTPILLVLTGTVWGDDTVSGVRLYWSSSNLVATGSIVGGPVSPTVSRTFSLTAYVDPGRTYQLAFLVPNTEDWIGFRAQFSTVTAVQGVPEPGAWALMLSAGAGLAYLRWRRRRNGRSQA